VLLIPPLLSTLLLSDISSALDSSPNHPHSGLSIPLLHADGAAVAPAWFVLVPSCSRFKLATQSGHVSIVSSPCALLFA